MLRVSQYGLSRAAQLAAPAALPALTRLVDAVGGSEASAAPFGWRSMRGTAAAPQQPSLAEAALKSGQAGTGMQAAPTRDSYLLMHPVYTKEYVESITFTHKPPERLQEKFGLAAVTALRKTFDWATKYGVDMNEAKYLQRFLYLETVAGVPGMVAGMLRHMRSLRSMKRDHGWIRTLLEEAENERMHLLTFLQMKEPTLPFRLMVLLGQGITFNAYLLCYLLSPRTCHAFVGYLEEQAVHTYTKAIEDLDAGKLPAWKNRGAPEIAKLYWRLGPDANIRDLLLAVRADEASHRDVNHTLSDIKTTDPNPFIPGTAGVP